jgi:hypothetical protein
LPSGLIDAVAAFYKPQEILVEHFPWLGEVFFGWYIKWWVG